MAGAIAGAGAATPPMPVAQPAVPPNPDDMNPAMMPAEPVTGTPTLFFLDLTANAMYRANADGSEATRIGSGTGFAAPDGIAVDEEGGYIYWSNMGGIGAGGGNNGSVYRMPVAGGDVEPLATAGQALVDNTPINTGKQLTLDRVNKKVYFSDREGGRVWRMNFDGSMPEILVSRSDTEGHDLQQPVGIAVDPAGGMFYFGDKNARKIRRAAMQMPDGMTHANRSDVQELYAGGANTEPIDLDLDLENRHIYWTDRATNTLQRAGMDLLAGESAAARSDIIELASGFQEAIGLSIDFVERIAYTTEFNNRRVSSIKLNEEGATPPAEPAKPIAQNGSTGIAFVRLPE
jgi:sugar lactone lactonase YvrE